MSQKINQKGIEETISTVLKFVQSVEYHKGSTLIYVRKAGDLSSIEIDKLSMIGLKVWNIRPIAVTTKYLKETTGLELVLRFIGSEIDC